jgi:hypothetical protein
MFFTFNRPIQACPAEPAERLQGKNRLGTPGLPGMRQLVTIETGIGYSK